LLGISWGFERGIFVCISRLMAEGDVIEQEHGLVVVGFPLKRGQSETVLLGLD
jgi:hypothetical protein